MGGMSVDLWGQDIALDFSGQARVAANDELTLTESVDTVTGGQGRSSAHGALAIMQPQIILTHGPQRPAGIVRGGTLPPQGRSYVRQPAGGGRHDLRNTHRSCGRDGIGLPEALGMYLRGQYRHGSVKPPYGMDRADQCVAVLIRRTGYPFGGVDGNGGRRGAACQQDTGHEGPDFSARQGKQAPLKGARSCCTRPRSGARLDAVWRKKTRLHIWL